MNNYIESVKTAPKFANPALKKSLALKKKLVLDAERLVVDALRVVLDHGVESFSVCGNDRFLGVIQLRDLERFIYGSGSNDDLLFHKLNFDLRSAVDVVNRQINHLDEVV